MGREIFVNVPVKDLEKSKKFFSTLGFSFNHEFTDEKSVCLIVEKNIFVMLLLEKYYRDFIPGKKICDSSNYNEALLGISISSKEEVDELIHRVIRAGGKEYRNVQDHGWMYARAFQDIDGHIWELFYMNKKEMPEEMKNKKT
jgi:uncharacterized protein